MLRFYIFLILLSILLIQCHSKPETIKQSNADCYQLFSNTNQQYLNFKQKLDSDKLSKFLGEDDFNGGKIYQDTTAVTAWKSFVNKDVKITFSDSLIESVDIFSNQYSLSPVDVNIGDSLSEIDSIYILEPINDYYRIFIDKHTNHCGANIYLYIKSDTVNRYEIVMQK